MSNNQLALARRYRPRDFQAVVGQAATLRALGSALDNQRLHHAYLFTGTRGVGKTTLARIFAKALNCEQGISSKPCETCNSCQAINTGYYVDLIEVDAASRTKVEDTRELLENVQYLPTQGRFKIYLIDEVHMLSSHSFNALLKTLEEPPSHVKFLLATTDPQKLPITVLSRCLQFHLQCLDLEQIQQHLAEVLQKEKVEFETEALEDLARAAEGSMRDALSLLDRALAYGAGGLLAKDVRILLGLTEKGRLLALLTAILANDAEAALAEIKAMANSAVHFTSVLTELLTLLHQVALAQQLPAALDDSIVDPKAILALATQISPEAIQLYYQIALLGQRDLPYAPNAKMGFEMLILRMLAFQPLSLAELPLQQNSMPQTQAIPQSQTLEMPARKKIHINPYETPLTKQKQTNHSSALAKSTTSTETNISPVQDKTTDAALQQEPETKTPPITTGLKADPVLSDWAKLVPALKLTGMVKELASHCSLLQWSENLLELALQGSQKLLLNKRNEERLQQALSHYLQKPLQLKITLQTQVEVPLQETPAQQYQMVQEQAEEKAKQLIHNDPNVEHLLKRFDAKIEHVSSSNTEALVNNIATAPKNNLQAETVQHSQGLNLRAEQNTEIIDLPWSDE